MQKIRNPEIKELIRSKQKSLKILITLKILAIDNCIILRLYEFLPSENSKEKYKRKNTRKI